MADVRASWRAELRVRMLVVSELGGSVPLYKCHTSSANSSMLIGLHTLSGALPVSRPDSIFPNVNSFFGHKLPKPILLCQT